MRESEHLSLPVGYDQNEAHLVITAGVVSGIFMGSVWHLTGTLIGAVLGGVLGWWLAHQRRARADRALAERARLREQRDLRRTAIHEAGHLIVAWACSSVERVEEARIDAAGGHVRLVYRGRSLWSQLVVKLSGVAAETLVYSRGPARDAKQDLLLSLGIATSLVGTEPPWPALDEPYLNFVRLYDVPITVAEEVVLQRGYQMARRICRTHRSMLETMANLLLQRHEVTADDLTTALPCRAFTLTLGPDQFIGVAE